MVTETDSIILAPRPEGLRFAEHLRAIRGDIADIKLRVDELAGSYAGLLKIASAQGDTAIRLERRVERIEKRLELVD